MPPPLAPGALPMLGGPQPLPMLPGMMGGQPGLPPMAAEPSQQDLERQMLIEMLQQSAGLTRPQPFAPATGEGVGGRRVT